MKSNNNNIRKNACRLLLFYRSIYRMYRREPYVTDDQLKFLYNQYILIRGIYECGLISASTVDRAYYMYSDISYGRCKDDNRI